MSVGLFGAYTGSPRIQRAYANTAPCTPTLSGVVYDDTTLRSALTDASVTCIEIQQSFSLLSNLPVITRDVWNTERETNGLTIFGSSRAVTVDGEGNSGINVQLFDDPNPDRYEMHLSFSQLTLTDFASTWGGAIYAATVNAPRDMHLTLDNMTMTHNVATGGTNPWPSSGGAAYARSNTNNIYMTVTESTFDSNSAVHGGGLYVRGDDTTVLTLDSSTFSGNYVADSVDDTGLGGGAYVNASLTTVLTIKNDSLFQNNVSSGQGGAIFAKVDAGDVMVEVVDSDFATNSSQGVSIAGHGGAIFATGSNTSVTVDGTSSLTYNTAAGDGGAILAAGNVSNVTIGEGAYFGDNSAAGYGGAISSGGSIDVLATTNDPATFQSNTSGAYGGAISAASQGGTIEGAKFYDNDSRWGGGAIYVPGALTISHTTVSGNRTGDYHGGGIRSGSLTANYSSITENSTTGDGGGVFVRDSHASITNSFIGGNSAEGRGGGIYMWANGGPGGDIILNYSTLYDDTAASGAFEIHGSNVISTMSAVGSSLTGDIWELTGTVDDTNSVSTADDTNFGESVPWGPGAFNLVGFDGTIAGARGRTPSASSVLARSVVDGGFAPLANPSAPTVPDDQLGVTRVSPFTIGARQFIPPTPPTPPAPNPPNPNPPAPAPATPASAPRDVRAVAKVESAEVSWLPPASTGSFPVTSYQAVASPGGETCMVTAPALTCTITGLTAGKPYTVTARALTGAGWSEASSPSSVVVPLGPEVPTILITNSRDRAQKSMARIEGTTTGLVGAEVIPYVRIAGQKAFAPRASTRTVDADGNFVWQRKANKRFTVYFVSGDVTSNRLVIRPE